MLKNIHPSNSPQQNNAWLDGLDGLGRSSTGAQLNPDTSLHAALWNLELKDVESGLPNEQTLGGRSQRCGSGTTERPFGIGSVMGVTNEIGMHANGQVGEIG